MTPRLRRLLLATSLLAGAGPLAGTAHAEEPLRPQVGKPLQKASAALRAHRFAEASRDVAAAEAVGGRTPDENYVIAQMRAAIAQSSGDVAGAIAADDALIDNARTPAAEKLKLREAEIGIAYGAHDYARATTALKQYFAAGGRDAQMQTLLIQCYYLQKDYRDAAIEQSGQIAAEERAREKPTENQLQLLAAVQQSSGDTAGFTDTMVKLVRYYPKPNYWAQLVHGLLTDPNTPDRLRLDIDRIRLAVGLLTTTQDYTEMAELAIQQGRPVEAQRIIAKAYQTGAFGHDAGAAREAKLKSFADNAASEQKAGLVAAVTAARAAPNGAPLLAVGQAYADAGNPQAGVSLMKEGMAKGSLPYPDESMLHYGQALVDSGDKAGAIASWRSITRPGVVHELAQLWILQTAG